MGSKGHYLGVARMQEDVLGVGDISLQGSLAAPSPTSAVPPVHSGTPQLGNESTAAFPQWHSRHVGQTTLVGAVLCTAGRPAAALASNRCMPVVLASPTYDNQKSRH